MAITNVSDTAKWVAEYRAMETDRPDAIFRDPYARRLAGPEGAEIVAHMKNGRRFAWPMIVRTAVFDEIIVERIRAGVDLVLNLAAGLDARPWRLDLPATLRWIDVDLPGILEHKGRTLQGETPRCRYEAVMLDLTDRPKRQALFAQLGAACTRALVVTEGLLIYLDESEVAGLAQDLHAEASFRWWLIDLGSPRLLKFSERSWGKDLRRGNAPFKFGPAENTRFFEPHGWREIVYRGMMEEATRLHRAPAMLGFWRQVMKLSPARTREEFKRFSGNVVLERS
ncbi:MAG TPA: SAM-dependent methyltransferase [Gemmatimonadaceae bacterium]|nr:SAM-dependent methyltransferase [Gemmatimonadaceae bacterium]